MSCSYYFSWSKQCDPLSFPLDTVEAHHFYSEEKKILDLSSISMQASFGLKNKLIESKIEKQMSNFSVMSPKAIFPLKEKVSRELIDYIGLKNGAIFWTLSGAESIENVLKMVRDIKKVNTIVARSNSYHGASLGALSITGDWRSQKNATVDQWTLRIPEPKDDPSAKKAREIIVNYGPDKIAAICLETITGANGVIIPSKEWYQGIQSICDEFNIFLILDEVIAGFERTGKPFGLHHYPFLRPDFICLSKAITGGFIPFGAVWTGQEVRDYYEDNILACGLTNYAHPLGLAAVQGVLELTRNEDFLKHKSKLEKVFEEELNEIKNIHTVKEVRFIGLMAAIETSKENSFHSLIKRGIHLLVKPHILVLGPHLNLPLEDLKDGMKQLKYYLESL